MVKPKRRPSFALGGESADTDMRLAVKPHASNALAGTGRRSSSARRNSLALVLANEKAVFFRKVAAQGLLKGLGSITIERAIANPSVSLAWLESRFAINVKGGLYRAAPRPVLNKTPTQTPGAAAPYCR